MKKKHRLEGQYRHQPGSRGKKALLMFGGLTLPCYGMRKGSKMSMRETEDVNRKTKLWDIKAYVSCFLCGSYLIILCPGAFPSPEGAAVEHI